MAEWVRALAWTGDRTVLTGFESHCGKPSLRNFGNSIYPALPMSFGGDTKSSRSLLFGVYARVSKIPHQSALDCVTVVDSSTLREGQYKTTILAQAVVEIYTNKSRKHTHLLSV